jgi:hypothetical protein
VTRQRDRPRFGATRIVAAVTRARAHVSDSGWGWVGRRFPVVTSVALGLVVGFGFAGRDCALQWRRVASGCAAHVAGEGTPLGGLVAGIVTAAATWAILVFASRLRGGRKQPTVTSVSGWQLTLDGSETEWVTAAFTGWSRFGNRQAAWVHLEGRLPPFMDGLSRDVLIVPLWADFQLDTEPLRWPVPVRIVSLAGGHEGRAEPADVNGRWNASLLSRLT